jgi:hypothetical protein
VFSHNRSKALTWQLPYPRHQMPPLFAQNSAPPPQLHLHHHMTPIPVLSMNFVPNKEYVYLKLHLFSLVLGMPW